MLTAVLTFLPLVIAVALAAAALYGTLHATTKQAGRLGAAWGEEESPLRIRSPAARQALPATMA